MVSVLEIDESSFPLLVVTFRGAITAEAIARYYSRVDVWFASNKPVAVIIDVTRLDVPSASMRRLFSEATAARGPAIAKGCAGVAVVLSSTLIRGVVTALGWLHPPKHPQVEVATLGEARAACEDWLGTQRSASLGA